jgi:hypothetical protein
MGTWLGGFCECATEFDKHSLLLRRMNWGPVLSANWVVECLFTGVSFKLKFELLLFVCFSFERVTCSRRLRRFEEVLVFWTLYTARWQWSVLNETVLRWGMMVEWECHSGLFLWHHRLFLVERKRQCRVEKPELNRLILLYIASEYLGELYSRMCTA